MTAVLQSRSRLEQVTILFGVKVRLHFDKTEEILNEIVFVYSHIDIRLFKKQILKNK